MNCNFIAGQQNIIWLRKQAKFWPKFYPPHMFNMNWKPSIIINFLRYSKIPECQECSSRSLLVSSVKWGMCGRFLLAIFEQMVGKVGYLTYIKKPESRRVQWIRTKINMIISTTHERMAYVFVLEIKDSESTYVRNVKLSRASHKSFANIN